jgi:hypothetical protein
MEEQFPIGALVLLKGKHPWRGHTGTVTRYMDTPVGRLPVVKLADCRNVPQDHEAAIGSPDWARVLKMPKR